MNCPLCRHRVEPLEGSTWVVAWYSCPDCGHFWSARLRAGLPVPEVPQAENSADFTRLLLD